MAFRDGPFENLKAPLAWTAGLAVIVLVIGAVLLLMGESHDGPSPYAGGRDSGEAAAGPVGAVLSAPVRWAGDIRDGIGGYFFAVSENRRLKRELAEARGWRDQALAMKGLNARYEQMLGLQTDPPVPMQTARAVIDARGPFSRARLLDAGTAKGVRVGNPVINEHGLLGRITGAAGGYSRMALLTDVASRTPVLVERSDARAILVGDGSDNPRLDYVRGQGSVQAGDRILSSGDAGGVPRGLPIGVAAKGLDGSWRVKLFSDRGPIDFVRVLRFQNFSQLVDPNALNTPPLSGLSAAPPPTSSEAAAITDAATRREVARQAEAERIRQTEAAAVLRERQEAEARAAAAAAAQPAVVPPAPAGQVQ